MKLMIWIMLIMCVSSMRPQNRNRKLNNNVSKSILIKSTKSLHDFPLFLSSVTDGSSANLNPFRPSKVTIKSKQLNIELSDTITRNIINGYDMRNIVDKEYDFSEHYEKIYKINSLLKKKSLFLHPLEEHNKNKISPINIKIESDFDNVGII